MSLHVGIGVDTCGSMYVSEHPSMFVGKHCVSMFTSEGQLSF